MDMSIVEGREEEIEEFIVTKSLICT